MNRNITTGLEPTPSPLTKAFNDAIRPYQEQIEDLKVQLEDTMYRLQTLEDERADMHAWIDKRGLRAGKLFSNLPGPPNYTAQFINT